MDEIEELLNYGQQQNLMEIFGAGNLRRNTLSNANEQQRTGVEE
jgi:hypothetical protein